jgi:hypothetical protein
MVQDYSPRCEWCGKKLNKKERYHLKRKPNDPFCYKCFKWFKTKIKKAGLKTDMGERYP